MNVCVGVGIDGSTIRGVVLRGGGGVVVWGLLSVRIWRVRWVVRLLVVFIFVVGCAGKC